MRHLKRGRKLGRKRSQRKSLLKVLASNLILKEKIITTEAKAKELAPFVERHITKAKKESLTARRKAGEDFSPPTVKKLVDNLGKRYKNRKGGYTRIIKLGRRKSDSARMAVIELVK